MIARDRKIGFVHFLSISVARGLSNLSRYLISSWYLHLHKYRSQQSLQNLHGQGLMHLRPQVSTGSYGPLFFSGVRSSCPVCIGSISTSARCARVWLLRYPPPCHLRSDQSLQLVTGFISSETLDAIGRDGRRVQIPLVTIPLLARPRARMSAIFPSAIIKLPDVSSTQAWT